MVPTPDNGSLEQAKERFAMIDTGLSAVRVPPPVFVLAVVHSVVAAIIFELVAICAVLIGVQYRALIDALIDELSGVLLCDVRNDFGARLPAALHKGNDRVFGVFRSSVGFISLNHAIKLLAKW